MKKLITIITFFSFSIVFCQEEDLTIKVKTEKSDGEIMAESAKAGAANRLADAAEAAAMATPSITVKIPLETDLNNYTHIAIVSVDKPDMWTLKPNTKSVVKEFVNSLNSSPLTVVNPLDNKKAFKKNRQYLKNEKDSNWLYIYFSERKQSINTNNTLIIRDSSNKILYSASYLNTPINEVVYPLIGF